eukprot:TRINITY_DN390_c0_g1_i14.p1 TRINITY_DN390_c0_g1~~TRINITY_DN390_c0_g1_i14.p1  ORF type:complete len:288 (-),score=89.38 TRINITY_DN390_c0_g1_i14:323-1186(-)
MPKRKAASACGSNKRQFVEESEAESAIACEREMCSAHPSNEVSLFCVREQQFLCVTCLVGSEHSKHAEEVVEAKHACKHVHEALREVDEMLAEEEAVSQHKTQQYARKMEELREEMDGVERMKRQEEAREQYIRMKRRMVQAAMEEVAHLLHLLCVLLCRAAIWPPPSSASRPPPAESMHACCASTTCSACFECLEPSRHAVHRNCCSRTQNKLTSLLGWALHISLSHAIALSASLSSTNWRLFEPQADAALRFGMVGSKTKEEEKKRKQRKEEKEKEKKGRCRMQS